MQEVKTQIEALLQEYTLKEQLLLDGLSKEERIEIGYPIKDIYKLDSFMACNRKYVIRTSLTIARFEQFESLQARVGYGATFRQMFANIRKSFDHLDKNETASASVVLYNIMNGIKNELDGRENEILMMCSLFICTENEDLSLYDEEVMKSKIKDWTIEGIGMDNFFTLAFSLVNSFIPVYSQVSASISDHLKNVENELKNVKTKKSILT